MTRAITLEIDHPSEPPGPIAGFRFFWAFRVSGFRADRHCQPCFRGTAAITTATAQSGCAVTVELQEQHRFLYVCGVGSGPRHQLRQKNFHLPLRYEQGGRVERTTYNGYTVVAHNAVEVAIPPLEKGWGGRDEETTRCKNFQFGVAYFGAPGASLGTHPHRS